MSVIYQQSLCGFKKQWFGELWVLNEISSLNILNFLFKVTVKISRTSKHADTKAANYYFSEVYKPFFWKDHPLILSTDCHSEELNLVFVDSCQGIPGGRVLFVFDGASVCIHSCLTSIEHKKGTESHLKRNWIIENIQWHWLRNCSLRMLGGICFQIACWFFTDLLHVLVPKIVHRFFCTSWHKNNEFIHILTW